MFPFPLKIDQLLIKVLPGAELSKQQQQQQQFQIECHFQNYFLTYTSKFLHNLRLALSQAHTYLYGIYYDWVRDAFGEYAMENGFV